MPVFSTSLLLALLAAIGCAAQLIGGESCRECSTRQQTYREGSDDTDLQRKNEQLYADYKELNALLKEIELLERKLYRQESKGSGEKATAGEYDCHCSNHHIKRDLSCDDNTSAEEEVKVGVVVSGSSAEETDSEPKTCVPPGGVAVKDYLPMLNEKPIYRLGVRINPWNLIPGYRTNNLVLY